MLDVVSLRQNMIINKITNQLDTIIAETPYVCLTLGSGLDSLKNHIINKKILKYDQIKSFLTTKVSGHSGEFIFGYINNVPVLCANGRFHYYEGYSFDEVGILQKIFNHYNTKMSIITNSSGCLRLKWGIGEFMIANQLLDYSFIDSSDYTFYKAQKNKELLEKINTQNIHFGCYTYTIGPTYETLSEIQDIKSIGGDAVGMSTFPEFLMCEKLNMDYMIISCLTNYGAGITKGKVEHSDVLKNAIKYKENFCKLIISLVSNYANTK